MNKKRWFCAFLCFCLVCSCMTVSPKAGAVTNISAVSITVCEPGIGEKPSVTASVPEDAGYYIKEVTWGGVKTFQANTAYTVSILLAVKDSTVSQFVMKTGNSAIQAVVNGNQAEWYHSSYQPGKELYVKYTFPAMKKTVVSTDAVAISDEKDLLKIRENLGGSYYLTKDITLSENTQILDDFSDGAAFTGVFDGRGNKLKGYTADITAGAECPRVSLFGNTKDAVFKNLTLSKVAIKVKSDKGVLVSALCNGSAKCTNVTIDGTISVTGEETKGEYADYEIYGFCKNGTFKKCINKTKISVDCEIKDSESRVAGIANFGTFKNCINTGSISTKGSVQTTAGALGAAGVSISGTLTGCKNKGAIKAEGEGKTVYAVGVCHEPDKMSGCSNIGRITAKNTSNEKTYAAGVAVTMNKPCTKCFNTGAVFVTLQTGPVYCGGVFAWASGWVKECYNIGNVTVTAAKRKVKGNEAKVGGVIGEAGRISECYNTGKISANAVCQIGGVAGMSDAMDDWTVIHCYNTGRVSGKGGNGYPRIGGVLGTYDNARVGSIGKYYVYDNYSTTSPVYGTAINSWKAYRAHGKKVAAINKKNCQKLSGKYWTYSKKHKRFLLKNNKEK